MAAFDATESLTPFRAGRGEQAQGALLFDATQLRQADPRWFDPDAWGDRATPVHSGGRGGAWFIDASHGPCVLRQYLRGGWAAKLSRDKYYWRGADRVRSFAEFRLLRDLLKHELPVPRPIAACYIREGFFYRAWILLERLLEVQSLADIAVQAHENAPWAETGRLIARFHRAGLDHADLNAHNILFDAKGKGWMIDFDRSLMRIPATRWRLGNLARLQRSLRKLRGARSLEVVDKDFARLRAAYDAHWAKGF